MPLNNAKKPDHEIFTIRVVRPPVFLLPAQNGMLGIEPGAHLNAEGAVSIVVNDLDFTNEGQFAADSSTVIFTGNQNTTVTGGGHDFYKVKLAKSSGVNLQLEQDMAVSGEFEFSGNNNLLETSIRQLVLRSQASVTGANSTNFFLTDTSGKVLKEDLTNFTFLIGASPTTYNPISITQSGMTDHIAVRCLPDALEEGTSGNPFHQGVVAAVWDITETTAGDSDLSLQVQWESTDELSQFNRGDCGLARYEENGNWDLSPSNLSAASGSGPYSQSIAGVEPGLYIVADDTLMNQLLVNIKLLLQGPYNGTTMNDQIRNAGNLPVNTPYGSGKFTNSGRGGGEMATATAFDANGDDSVVDWVFVWLKDPVDPSQTLQTRSALVQKDGDVVDLDGVSPLKIPGDSAMYHLGVGHRNHLSVRTANALMLKETLAASHDFSTGAGQAYGTNPMAEQSGVYLLWGGNTNENTNVRSTGPPVINDYSTLLSFLGASTNVLFNQYASEDVNMDGTVRATGPPVINDYSKLLNILGSPTNIIYEQF